MNSSYDATTAAYLTQRCLLGTGLGATAGALTGARTACSGSACTTTTWGSWTPAAGLPPQWKRRSNPPPLRTAPCRPRVLSPWTPQWSRAPTTATTMAACSAPQACQHHAHNAQLLSDYNCCHIESLCAAHKWPEARLLSLWVWHACQHEMHCFAAAAVRGQSQAMQQLRSYSMESITKAVSPSAYPPILDVVLTTELRNT